VERTQRRAGVPATLEALQDTTDADVVSLRAPVDSDSRRVLLRASAAVLANGQNAVVLQTEDPREFVGAIRRLQANRHEERALRRAGQATARRYAWPEIVERLLLPNLHLLPAAS
jgi:hypothetical protein